MYMNLTELLLKLNAGSTIETFTAVEADQVDDRPQKIKIQKAKVEKHSG